MGKPPISDAVMRGMHETMQQIRAAKRRVSALELSRADRNTFLAEPESLTAALLSQVHRRDTLLTQGTLPSARVALETAFAGRTQTPRMQICPGTAEECAATAAGMALQLRETSHGGTAGARPVVLALLGSFPALTGVLRLVQEHSLSLLLIVQGEAETRADAQRRLLSTKAPILTVDATDAIAVCRVTQESMLRARNGWGGTVIHALQLPSPVDPMEQIESHMRARGILPPRPG